MRLSFTLFLLYVCLPGPLQAQSVVTKSTGDAYMESAQTWRLKNDSARANADIRKGIAAYLKNRQLREAAEGWLTLENYYAFFNGPDYGPRIAYYQRALTLFNQARITDRAAATLGILGDFYWKQGQLSKASQAFTRSLSLYQSIHKTDLQGLYNRISTFHTQMGNYDQALKYGILAVRATEKAGDTSLMLCTALNSVGFTYFNLKNYKRSLLYFERALTNAKRNKNLDYIIILSYNVADALKSSNRPLEGYQLMKETEKNYHPGDVANRIMINVSCLGSLIPLKRYSEARKYADSLLQLESRVDTNDANQAVLFQTLSMFFMAVKSYEKARLYNTRYESMGRTNKQNNVLLNAYRMAYEIDSAKGDFLRENKSYRQYIKFRDFLFDETKTRQIAQLEIQYQTEKKDQEIKSSQDNIVILKQQAQLQAINIKQQQTTQKLSIAGVILLALLLGLSYNRYLSKQRLNRQLQLQQSEINLKNHSLTNLIAEKDNLLEEKEWLMKEIHHRVKNNLQIVISLLNTQSSFLNDKVAYNAIRESQHRMQSISLIHQKLYQSDSLALVNMPAYISDLVQYLSETFDIRSRIRFEMAIDPIELDVTKSVPLGLILNEAITNSIKYAFADNGEGLISIRLVELSEGSYGLTIRDNGIGLAVNSDISKSKTLGMSLMRGLSKQLSGSFSVENNDGITINVVFAQQKIQETINA